MNPEFRRNMWLEFSLHRLIATPVVITLLLALVAAASNKDWLANLSGVSAWGFGLAVLLWGTQLVAASVSAEARERTWDTQRMSAIGPWAMTWGKLLGAPAFAWYVGLIFQPGEEKNPRGASIMIFVVLLFFVVVPGMRLVDEFEKGLVWWGMAFSTVNFALASTAAFAALAVIGAYRSMCTALEIRTRPWALPGFTVFSALWINGFFQVGKANEFNGLFGVLLCAVVVSSAFCYALLLAEAGGASAWQRLRVRLRTHNTRRILEEAPLWLVAIVTGLIMGLAAMLTPTGNPNASNLLPFAAMLFVLRDAAIFQFFALAREPRRAEAAALFYLVLLYGLLPGLLHAVNADFLAHLVLPMIFTESAMGTVIMLVQAGIAMAAAWWRWKTVHAPDTE